jgi:uncharacterized membrane protein YphA (DoxX/SURF4 family)
MTVQIISSVCLSFIFCLSAVAKLRDMPSFRAGVADYRLLPRKTIPYFAWLLVCLELIFGVTVLLGPYRQLSALGLSLLTIMFMVAVGVNMARGNLASCHCFGESSEPIGWKTIAREVGVLILALSMTIPNANLSAGILPSGSAVQVVAAICSAALLLHGYRVVEFLLTQRRHLS